MDSSDRAVAVEHRGSVRIVRFCRPRKLNALTVEMLNLYHDVLADADADPSVRAIVVTGEGSAFSAGADFDELAAIARPEQDRDGYRPPGRPIPYPASLHIPVIAAINGPAVGLGLAIALWADIRFVASDARLSTAFTRRGLVAEHGVSWLLPRLVGTANALDLLLSGRFVSGDDARALGLANRVVPSSRLVDEAVGYATDLAEHCSPTAMAAVKAQVWRHLGLELAEALTESNELMARSFSWPDVREGVASYRERRVPRFPPIDTASLHFGRTH